MRPLNFAATVASLAVSIVIIGCGDDTTMPPADSGTDGAMDTGTGDSSAPDTGTNDSSAPDSGGDDGGGSDTGAADGGSDASGDGGGDAGDAGIDAGGLGVGERCRMSDECASGICIARVCRAPSCTDGVMNGDETGRDCGGSTCAARCPTDEGCDVDGDCVDNICTGNVCVAPACDDGVMNQDETDVDCGGPTCTDRCINTEMCVEHADCESAVCVSGVCEPPSCADGIMNGTETDIDCGGPARDGCDRCPDYNSCGAARDCVTGTCTMGVCGTDPCVPFASDASYIGCSYTPTTLPCPDIRTTGTATGLGYTDDVMVSLPFAFDFYGTTYNEVYIHSHGAVAFTPTTSSLTWSNSCLPGTSSSIPDAMIMPLWDDLDTDESGSEVYYETVGAGPDRRFVVQWDTSRWISSPSNALFTVVLNRRGDLIEVCYPDTDFGNSTYDQGASATAGIRNGTDSVELSCNMPDLTDGLLVKYIPR